MPISFNKLTEKYVLGVKINTGFTLDSCITYIDTVLLKKNEPSLICTTNPEIIMACQDDPIFKDLINNAALSVPDGSGVVMAMCYLDSLNLTRKRFGKLAFISYCFLKGVSIGVSSLLKLMTLPPRVSGVDLTYRLCELAAKNNYTVYLLGGWPRDFFGRRMSGNHELARNAAQVLKKMYPGVRIVGTSSEFSPNASDDVASLSKIHSDMSEVGVNTVDIFIAAYNYNGQEKWLHRNASKIPAKVCMGVGGTFDYITGNKKYSPVILRNSNLEWLFKLLTQPWRWKRVALAFPLFPLKVFNDVISH